MARYRGRDSRPRRRFSRRLWVVAGILIVTIVIGVVFVRHYYYDNLKPVSGSNKVVLFTIKNGESSSAIAKDLQGQGLIRNSNVFELYIGDHQVRSSLQAGTYALRPNMGVVTIVEKLTQGKIASKLVTIVPGERIDQVRETFIEAGFKAADVDAALDVSQYSDNEALADKPAAANLEGFLYPDSFQKTSNTTAKEIVQESLDEMAQHLTPAIRTAYAKQGLSVYQGVTLASIVEREVSNNSDRSQVAQVFLKRLKTGMTLGSDVTAFYGAHKAGVTESVSYDSAYNTLLHKGLPPGPISSVSDQSLQAVAHPATTDWLYFVSGDNGKTYFSKTLEEHNQQAQKYCHKLCTGTQ